MEDEGKMFRTLLERAEEYSKTNYELLKLKTVDTLSDGASTAASKVVASFFFVLFIIMLSIGLALLIGDLLGKGWYGFMVMAGVYAVLGSILFFFKHNWLKERVNKSIIKQFLG